MLYTHNWALFFGAATGLAWLWLLWRADGAERRRLKRMPRLPVAGDVDAPRQPHLVVALHVIDEALQRGGAAGAADQPAVQPDVHHPRPA